MSAIRRPAEPEGALQDASLECFLKHFRPLTGAVTPLVANPNANRADMTSG